MNIEMNKSAKRNQQKEPLSAREKEVLTALTAFFVKYGVSPTEQELALSCDLSRATVHRALDSLRKKGRISRGRGKRTLQLVA